MLTRKLALAVLGLVFAPSMSRADSCENIVNSELKGIGAGTYGQPAGGINRSVNEMSSRAFSSKLDKILGSDAESMNAFAEGTVGTPNSQAALYRYQDAMAAYMRTRVGKQFRKQIEDLKRTFNYDEAHESLMSHQSAFTSVVRFDGASSSLRAFRDGTSIVALTVRDGNRERLLKLTPDCKINEIVVIDYLPNGSSLFQYLSPRLCQNLSTYEKLTNKVQGTSPNQFGFRCSEQGGKATGDDGDSGGCKCPDGKYVNPWAGSCLATPKKPTTTPQDDLEKFVASVGSGLSPSAKKSLPLVQELCRRYANDLAPADKSGATPPSNANSAR